MQGSLLRNQDDGTRPVNETSKSGRMVLATLTFFFFFFPLLHGHFEISVDG